MKLRWVVLIGLAAASFLSGCQEVTPIPLSDSPSTITTFTPAPLKGIKA